MRQINDYRKKIAYATRYSQQGWCARKMNRTPIYPVSGGGQITNAALDSFLNLDVLI